MNPDTYSTPIAVLIISYNSSKPVKMQNVEAPRVIALSIATLGPGTRDSKKTVTLYFFNFKTYNMFILKYITGSLR